MTRTTTFPSIDQLSDEFRAVMQQWFPDGDTLQVIDSQNSRLRVHPDPLYRSCCASGDHCDSNMAMVEAWENLVDIELDPGSQEQADIWNAAWDKTKTEGFAG
jgi:hypothetical protein